VTYIKLKNGEIDVWPYDINTLINDFPNTSFPHPIPKETLEKYEIYELIITQAPSNDDPTKKLVQKAPELIDGYWQIRWDIVDADAGELNHVENVVAPMRAKTYRDALLSQSDWTQLPDAPLTPEKKLEWTEYRQSLRGITKQEGFPLNIVWPETPTK